jgi:hypothetical protein
MLRMDSLIHPSLRIVHLSPLSVRREGGVWGVGVGVWVWVWVGVGACLSDAPREYAKECVFQENGVSSSSPPPSPPPLSHEGLLPLNPSARLGRQERKRRGVGGENGNVT